MNPFTFSLKIFLLILLLGGSQHADCQTSNDSTHTAWVSAGLAKYVSYNSAGGGYGISLNNVWNKFLWEMRFVHINEGEEKFNEIGILFGGSYLDKNTRFSISGGLSHVSGTIMGELPVYTPWNPLRPTPKPDTKSFTAVGIPFKAQMSFLLSANIGIGISLFADLNFQRSFYGINFTLELGSLK